MKGTASAHMSGLSNGTKLDSRSDGTWIKKPAGAFGVAELWSLGNLEFCIFF